MPNSVDNRVVEMQFDNAKFEKNIHQSIKSLEQLDKALELEDAAKGFENMEKAANSIDLSKLEKAAEMIEKRFSAAGIAGAAAIQRVTNTAIDAVVGLGRKVVNLAKSGGIARALKLEHANFMLNGLIKNSAKVAEILDGPVNNAVSGTAYGLDAAANAAAQLVASGVTDMKKLENALTAISGVAAMTGAQYEEISDIFTSAAGKGKVMTMEFNRINQRGVAAFAAVAKYLNKTEEEVRDMAKKGKISFEMFAEAMNDAFGEQAKKANDTFNGAMSNVRAALSRIGAKIATPALEGLRKTFVSLIEVINNVNKHLSQGIIPKIVNFIKHLGNIAPMVLKSKRFMNLLTSAIDTLDKAFTNFTFVMQIVRKAFKNVFPDDAITRLQNIQKIFDKIVDMFDITGEKAAYLQMTLEGVFRVFDIIFTIVGQVLSILVPGFDDVFKATDSVITNILKFTAYISVLLEHFDKWLKQNNLLKAGLDLVTGALSKLTGQSNIFMSVISVIGGIIMGIVSVFYTIGSAIGSFLIEAYKLPIVQTIIGNIKDSIVKLGNLALPILALMAAGFESMMDSLEKFSNGGYITRGLEKLNDALNGLYWGASYAVDGIKAFFGLFKKGDDAVEKIERVVVASEKLADAGNNLGVTTGVVTRHANEFAGATTVLEESATSLANKTTDTFMTMEQAGKIFTIGFAASIISAGVNIGRAFRQIGAVARNIKATTKSIRFFFDQLQLNLRIKTLLSLAVAIAVLAGSLALLTQLDTGKLVVATACIAGLVIVLGLMSKALTSGNVVSVKKFQLAAEGMLEFAASLLVLAAAAKVLSSIVGSDLPTIAKGVGALIAIMLSLAGVIILIGRFQKNAIQGGAAILALSAGIYLIMQSLIKIQQLDLDKINEALPTMLKIMGGLALVAFATTSIISPFGGLSFAGVVAGVLLLFEGFSKLSKVDNKVLYQVEDLIDHLVMAIQHILEFLIVLQALSMLEQAFMWGTTLLSNITKKLKGMFIIAQKGIKYLGVAAIILSIAVAIKFIGDTIIALSVIDAPQLATGVLMAVSITLAVYAIVEAITRMTANLLNAGASSMQLAGTFAGLAAIMISFTLSIKILADMDDSLFMRGLIKVGLMELFIYGLVGALSTITASSEVFQPALRTLSGIAILLGVMVGAVAVLSLIPWETYVPAMASLVAMIAVLGVVLIGISGMANFTPAATVAVFGIGAIFVGLAYAMSILVNVTTSNVLFNMMILESAVGVMAIIVKALVGLGPDIALGIAALAGITGVLILLTGVATMLNEVDSLKFLANIGNITLAIFALSTAMGILGAIAANGGAIAMGAGIAILGALAVVMGMVSDAAMEFGNAAILIASGLNGISTSLIVINTLDLNQMATDINTLGGALNLLTLSTNSISSFSNVLGSASVHLGSFGNSLRLAASGLEQFNNLNLENLLPQLIRLGQAVDFVNQRFLQFAAFSLIATTVGAACIILGTGLATVSAGLLGVTVSIDAFMIAFSVLVAAFGTLGEIIDRIVLHLTDMVNSIKEMGATTISDLYDALITYARTQLWEAGQTMMIYIQNGFDEQIPTSVSEVLYNLSEEFKGEIGRYEADIYTTGFMLAGFFKSGMDDCLGIGDRNAGVVAARDTATGMINEAERQKPEVEEAFRELGEAADEGVREPLGAYCEGETGVECSSDTATGMINEAERQRPAVYGGYNALGNAAGSGLWDGLKGWLSGIAAGMREWWDGVTDGSILDTSAIMAEVEEKVA
ncbi:MAG: tape measure protein, partial [Pseudobutyrivibrio sp.]|nr:tape measure protein [Pseudobutyrivibrio sp.]